RLLGAAADRQGGQGHRIRRHRPDHAPAGDGRGAQQLLTAGGCPVPVGVPSGVVLTTGGFRRAWPSPGTPTSSAIGWLDRRVPDWPYVRQTGIARSIRGSRLDAAAAYSAAG